MKCPGCGSSVHISAGRCPTCSTSLGPFVATGVLTPPPVDPPTGPTFAPQMDSERTVVTPRGDTLFQDPSVRGGTHGDQTVVGSAAVSRSEDTGPLRIGQSFGLRYHIIKVLGVGGMGAVYQAWDAELAEA